MSKMWDVKVINKGEDWIDLKVVLGHPDGGPFPEDPIFALELLTSEAYSIDENFEEQSSCSLGEEFDSDTAHDPDELAPHVDKYIRKVVIYEARNLPFDEKKVHAKIDEQVQETSLSKDNDEWKRVWNDKWGEFWDNEDNLPIAKYHIIVTDSKWIEHMTIGLIFDTAAYSNGPWLDENRIIEIENQKL